MELSDRAAEYSEAGHRLASSFTKGELTLTTVQAELMRACFEKTTGSVIEAWHTLGNAIRDAQELGLHLIEPETTAYLRSEKPSDRELGCHLWFILHLWDAHMAVVLGRPMSTRMNPNAVPLPMSSRDSSGKQRPPQPSDVILCGYHTAYHFLQDIHDLEKVGDWRVPVETIHETILTNVANLPAWATAQRSRQVEQVPVSRRNLEWGLERLKSLQASNNHLASSALDVIQRLYRKMLAVVSPMQPLDLHHGGAENGNFVGIEAEMARVDWDTFLQPDFGNVFVPQPLNELLCSQYLGQSLSISPVDQAGYGSCQFGSDNIDSLGNDLITDHNADRTSNGAN
ncbi:hypothetical protein NW762_011013 [Fusarium torreyae]|uniref:Xylanolytic transcriptional activator regulatory domain-containing protein n=1 Tax=Fusarium torreyae TaxID=1237075 RepID=A0A9W8VB02_9HYPO|nr:hypothetical protein NW762_011013 [Fusarium torreyae]